MTLANFNFLYIYILYCHSLNLYLNICTLETSVCRPPLGPSTRNNEAPSASRSTAKLSTVCFVNDLRSSSVATSRTQARKKSLSPRQRNNSRLACLEAASGAQAGRRIFDSISRRNMLNELGGNEVYLKQKTNRPY